MADGRKNNGGPRPGAGRPKKAEEEKVRNLGLKAISETFGDEEGIWKHIAKEAKKSYPHLKLLVEHIYGKPKETKNHHFDNLPFDIIVNEFRDFKEPTSTSS